MRKRGFMSGLIIGSIIGYIATILASNNDKKEQLWFNNSNANPGDSFNEIRNFAYQAKEKVVKTAKEARDVIEDSLSRLTEAIKEKEKENDDS